MQVTKEIFDLFIQISYTLCEPHAKLEMQVCIYKFDSLWVNGATVSKCMAAMNECLQGVFKLDLIFKFTICLNIYMWMSLTVAIHATAVV